MLKQKVKTPKKPQMDSRTVERRKRTIERLEKQLKSGKKPERNGEGKTHLKKKTDLNPKDIERINRELEILKNRVN